MAKVHTVHVILNIARFSGVPLHICTRFHFKIARFSGPQSFQNEEEEIH